MAKAKKKRYQLLRDVVLGALVFIMLAVISGGIAQAAVVFMLTGIVGDTNIVVPVWGMVALYMGVLSLISLTYYIDRELELQHLKKLEAVNKLPRRRYGL